MAKHRKKRSTRKKRPYPRAPRRARAEPSRPLPIPEPWPFWVNRALLLASLLLAATLRFHQLQTHSLTRDEINVVTFSFANVVFGGETFVQVLMSQLMMRLTGSQNEFILRFPGTCAGVLGVAATYLLGRRLFRERAALLGAFSLALSRFEIAYSQDISHYPYFLFASVLSLYFLHRATIGEDRRAWWGFAVSTIINLNCHLGAYLVLGLEILWLGLRQWPAVMTAIRKRRRAPLTPDVLRLVILLFAILLVLALGPLLTAFFSLEEHVNWVILIYLALIVGIAALGHGTVAHWLAVLYANWRPTAPPKSPRLWRLLALLLLLSVALLIAASGLSLRSHVRWIFNITAENPFFVPRPPWEMVYRGFGQFSGARELLIPFLVALAAGLWRAWRERRQVAALLALWLILPWAVIYIPTGHPFFFRFMMFMVPVYLLTVAAGLEVTIGYLGQAIGRLIPAQYTVAGLSLIIAVAIGAAMILPLQKYYWQGGWDDWRGAARFLEANVQEGDGILLSGRGQSLYYYAPHLKPSITRLTAALPQAAEPWAEGSSRLWIIFDLWDKRNENLFPDPGLPSGNPALQAWIERETFARVDFDGCVVLYKDPQDWSATMALEAEIRLLKQAIALASTGRGHLYAALGADYAAAGRWQEAAEEYETAVHLEFDKARYHWQLGQVYEQLGDRDAALASYRRVLRLEPEHSQAQQALQHLGGG